MAILIGIILSICYLESEFFLNFWPMKTKKKDLSLFKKKEIERCALENVALLDMLLNVNVFLVLCT